jgi:hypothetical protein
VSWKATAHVKELTHAPDGKRLTRSEKFLMLIIADYYNDEYGCAWPSVKRQAEDALMSERQVQRLHTSLKNKKALHITPRTGKPSLYRFPGLMKPAEIKKEDTPQEPRSPDEETGEPQGGDILSGVTFQNEGVTFDSQGGDISAQGGDIAVSPEPSCHPSVFEPPVLTVSQSPENQGFEIIKDTLGRTYYKRTPRHKTPDSDSDSTDGKNFRWTLKDDDPQDFKLDEVLTTYKELTGNPVTKSDKEIAEILGSYGRFASSAVCELMKVISQRAKTKIGSMSYFRTGINEIAGRCVNAALTAGAMAAGGTAEAKKTIELKTVRREVHQWKERAA